MNERIKELAEQAGARTKDVCYGHGEYYDEFQLINDDIEKFAKLIVQECARVIILSHNGHINPKFVVDPLKEHFGIKE